jgi:hypothetical protein
VSGVELQERHPELQLEGLLDEAKNSHSTQPTLRGKGGVGGVELLERHPDFRLEGLLREKPIPIGH